MPTFHTKHEIQLRQYDRCFIINYLSKVLDKFIHDLISSTIIRYNFQSYYISSCGTINVCIKFHCHRFNSERYFSKNQKCQHCGGAWLSGGPPWPCPSLGAEISMLLLLSLLLELRPGLDSPSRPELSWEKGGECATYCEASNTAPGNYT